MGNQTERLIPASLGQQRLWLLAQLEPDVPLHNLGRFIKLSGRIHPKRVERALHLIATRHEPLRTHFTVRDGVIAGIVSPFPLVATAYTDLRYIHEPDRESEFIRIATSDTTATFALDQPPLWRTRLVRMSDDDWLLVHVAHHMIFDQLSAANFDAELTAYLASEIDEFPALQPLPVTYTEYAAKQCARMHTNQPAPRLSRWLETLADLPEDTGLPTDRPRPANRTYRGGQSGLTLSHYLATRVTALAEHHHTQPFLVLFAGFATLLHRYTSRTDIVIGTTVQRPYAPSTLPLIGAMTNTLVIRTDVRGDLSFREVLTRVAMRWNEATANQDVPFARIVELLAPDRDMSRPPLYQIGFHLTPGVDDHVISTATTDLDLNITVAATADRTYHLTIEYAADLFDTDTVLRFVAAYQTLLMSIANDDDAKIAALRILPEDERRQLSTWEGPRRDYPYQTLHCAVFEQAEVSRDAPAIGYGGCWLTYGELVDEACRIANWLLSAGVKPETTVGVCLTRDTALLPVLLGVLTAGCAYLPLEPTHPTERIRGMLDDSRARYVVTTSLLTSRLPATASFEVLCTDTARAVIAAQPSARPFVHVSPDALSYVMFTSGSTGRPRGTGVTHRAIVNRLCWMREELAIEHTDRVLHKTPYTFDVSVWELFWPLIAGAGVVIAAPGGHADPEYLARLIDQERVTVAHFVPSMLEAFLDQPEILGLDRVVCSGEVLSPQLVTRCFERLPGVRLYNLYGPTEAAIDVSWHPCVPGEQRVPIGRPVANTKFEILDRGLRRVPIGAVGELCIGGVQLARGYIGQPKLTERHFIQDPYGPPGTRLYRTGDLARWRANGEVEFIGRSDDQVKVRGVRIEPGEIRTALERHLNVDRAVVAFRDDVPGGPGLVAYVRWTGAPDSLADVLWKHLRTRLPKSMVPRAFVQVEHFPVLPNGKLDSASLPAPHAEASNSAGYVAPRTPMELRLCHIWGELLDRPDVGVADNFFALGGNSLLAVRLVDQISQAFGVTLAVRQCFELGTVADYAMAILDMQLQQATYDIDDLINAIRMGEPGL